MKKTVIALLGLTAAAAVAGDIACDYTIKRPDPARKKPETKEKYIKRAEVRRKNNRRLYEKNPEDICIKSVDNLNMRAWLVQPEKPSRTFVICVHGYRCNGPDEFSHMMPFYSETLGYNYLLPDLTGHGRSEGKYAGFGSFDAKNVLLWVDYLINRFGRDIKIILHGISMGGATVLNVNESDPPEQVRLIIEDCGFIGAFEEINDTLKEMAGIELRFLVRLGSLFSKIKAGYFFEESNPLKNMPKAKRPVLFIHGEADTFVPFKYGKMLYEACPTEKDYLWVPGAVHAFSYYDAKEEYEEKVTGFINKYLD